MTVLVTGAAGFLGRHLTASLLDDGHEVAGVDNFITSDSADLRPLLRRPGFSFEELDITGAAFRTFASGLKLEAIYNLACPTGVPNLGPMALEMLRTCYEGSYAVLELAREQGCPALVTSTAEVYGNPEVVPQPESYTGNVDTLGPRKGYEEGKRVAETLFGIYAERYGVAAKVARVFNTYGPGMCLTDTRVVPSFVRKALLGEPLVVHGDGGQTRCHVYASDQVAGLRLVLQQGMPARAYNIGTQTPFTVGDLAELVLELTGSRSEIQRVERPAHDHDRRLPDTTRVRTELGWEPRMSLKDGLRATIEDFSRRLGVTIPNAVAV